MIELAQLYLGDLRLSDVIDIVLLWFVLYQALILLRGTRALQSLLGIAAAGALYVIAAQFELYAVHWIFEKFFDIAVLAVLILFQNDIRRGLAGAGGRLFPTFGQKSDQTAFEEIVRASFLMASRRIGALIAVERQATLQEYADSGSRLDARLSAELLLSIFHPTSPLHDGAVVVRRGQVLAGKVFLPLSLSREISRFVGTRHRAAVGLTEETDAVVVIVSEERGTVAVVVAGEVRPVADANELRQRLVEAFDPATRPQGVLA
ncbi:MAG: TIGR00159 family protein [Deltaproteobacteria bacterium]|nr:TIGR00159 family protein [Deltaproteobacteria bacterium]